MNLKSSVLAVLLACSTLSAQAQMLVFDVKAMVQTIKQLDAWRQQLTHMRYQIDAMTGPRGMENVLGMAVPALPADWARATTELTSLANEIRRTQAVLTPDQAARLAPDLRRLLAEAQNLSASTQAMAQVAYKDAATERRARIETWRGQLALTKDPKAAYDLSNAIALEQASLANEQNQLAAAENAAAAAAEAQRLQANQMRMSTSGTGKFPKIDFTLP